MRLWMRTTGTALLTVQRCSLVRVLMPARDCRRAHALLYLAAVRPGRREQERRQGTIDIDPSCVRHCQPAGYRRSPGNLASHFTLWCTGQAVVLGGLASSLADAMFLAPQLKGDTTRESRYGHRYRPDDGDDEKNL